MAARPKVIVTASVESACLADLAPHARILMNTTSEPWPHAQLLDHCRDAYAMIAFMPDKVDEDMLRECPSLRIIAGALKGYDNFDVEACTRHGTWLTVVPDLLSAPTADLTISLLLALSRNLVAGDRLIRRGNFRAWRPILYGSGIAGATVGILGFGAVGQEIALRLTGFGPNVLYFDNRRPALERERALGVNFGTFDEIIETCNIVILALPLSDSTCNIIDHDVLARMKPGCLLINPARGSLVNEDAIADALDSGQLGGYAADVFACEDIALADRPSGISDRLLANDGRTVLTPHLGSAVETARHDIVTEAACNVLDCLENRRPRGAVNMLSSMTGFQ